MRLRLVSTNSTLVSFTVSYKRTKKDSYKRPFSRFFIGNLLPILYRHHQRTRFLLRSSSAIVGFKAVFNETVVGE